MTYNKINTYWLSDNGISGDRGRILHLDIAEGNYPVLWIQTNGDPIIIDFDNREQQKEIYWDSYVSGSCYDELQWIWDCTIQGDDEMSFDDYDNIKAWLEAFRPENQWQWHEFYRVFEDGKIEYLIPSGQWVKDTTLPEYCDEVTMDSEPPIEPIQPGVECTYYRQERWNY